MKATTAGRWGQCVALLLASSIGQAAAQSERINQEGRILGPLPPINGPILFNTPEADAMISAMQIFPITSSWNEDISRRPVLANSNSMIAQIKSDLASSRQTCGHFTK